MSGKLGKSRVVWCPRATVCRVPRNKPRVAQVGVEFKAAREAAGLTLRELAERLPVGTSTISRWENGQRMPKPGDVRRYLPGLGAPEDKISQILELAENPSEFPAWLPGSLPAQDRQTTS